MKVSSTTPLFDLLLNGGAQDSLGLLPRYTAKAEAVERKGGFSPFSVNLNKIE